MSEIEGFIAIYDPKWNEALVVKEEDLGNIINYLNSLAAKITPENAYQYIKQISVGAVKTDEKDRNFETHVLPLQDLIPYSDSETDDTNKGRKSFTSSRACRISFIDFSATPDGEYKHVMIYQDQDTKFVLLKPLKSMETSDILYCLVEIFALIGTPSLVITNEKSIIKPVIQKITYFSENFESKVEVPDKKDSDGDFQQIKDFIHKWQESNDINNWRIGLNVIQFQTNCNYNKGLKASPFTMLFIPKYEYVRKRFTSFLIHKTSNQLVEESRTDTYNAETKLGKSEESTEFAHKKSDIMLGGTKDSLDSFYLIVSENKDADVQNNDEINSLIHIFENTNLYSLTEKNEIPVLDNINRKYITVYKKYDKIKSEPTKLEPMVSNNDKNLDVLGYKFENIKVQPHMLNKKNELKDETFSADPICIVCKKKKRKKKVRKNSKISAIKDRHYKVGDTVRLRTPIAERLKGHPNFIQAVILEVTPNGEYRIGTPDGILKDVYQSDYLMECNHALFDIESVPRNRFIDTREALTQQMKSPLSEDLIKSSCIRQQGFCNPKFTYHRHCIALKKNSGIHQHER